jgi:hypothetical protein
VKLISWNVNGLRAVLRKNFLEFLEAEAPESVCRDLADRLHEALSLRISVVAVPAGSLPRFELKARRWNVVPART